MGADGAGLYVFQVLGMVSEIEGLVFGFGGLVELEELEI